MNRYIIICGIKLHFFIKVAQGFNNVLGAYDRRLLSFSVMKMGLIIVTVTSGNDVDVIKKDIIGDLVVFQQHETMVGMSATEAGGTTSTLVSNV